MKPTTRRSFLQGFPVAIGFAHLPAYALSPGGVPDKALVTLAFKLQHLMETRDGFVDEVERRHGLLAYEILPDYRATYEQYLEMEEALLHDIAAINVDSLQGLIIKLRIAWNCNHLSNAQRGCVNEDILYPALADLEEMTIINR